jgi:hypothetical protein
MSANPPVQSASEITAPPKQARTLRQWAIKFHQWLALFGGAALLLWGLSGLLHPLMTTFGRQQEVFFPPHRTMDLHEIAPIHQTLKRAGIAQAAAVKVVVGEQENLLQVTEQQDVPRRYFSLKTGAELPNHDPSHAIYLARYYMKLPSEPIRSVEVLTTFTDEYPAVNRLLPVYRVSFDRSDGLVTYVYTETNALAGVTDSWKSSLQKVFQWVHTWSWMPAAGEWLRVSIVAFLIGSIVFLSISGVMMLVTIRRAVRAPGARGWHRIVGYGLAIPVFAFSASGLFHLLQYGWDEPQRHLKLSPPVDFSVNTFPIHQQWRDIAQGLNVNGVSLVNTALGEGLYRLSLAQPRQGGPSTPDQIRNARFDGVERTGPALYISAKDGSPWRPGDRELAMQLGDRFTGAPRSSIENMVLVTRFGPGYDFRNKRLPVWQIDYAAPISKTIFVDTATGVLADVTLDSAKPERWSFSILHKWNFLFPLGRDIQNLVVSSVVILMLIFMAGLGLQMELKRRRRLRQGAV